MAPADQVQIAPAATATLPDLMYPTPAHRIAARMLRQSLALPIKKNLNNFYIIIKLKRAVEETALFLSFNINNIYLYQTYDHRLEMQRGIINTYRIESYFPLNDFSLFIHYLFAKSCLLFDTFATYYI